MNDRNRFNWWLIKTAFFQHHVIWPIVFVAFMVLSFVGMAYN